MADFLRLLAIDCSLQVCSCALLTNNKITEKFDIVFHKHAEVILSMVDQSLKERSLTLKNLHAIAFAAGPGAFTGIRIAASVTQGLAFAVNLPVIPVSTLQTIAQGLWRQDQIEHTIVTINAKMGEWYRGEYQLSREKLMEAIMPDQLIKPDLIQLPERIYVPHAQDVISIAERKYRKGELVTADQALPVYLRKSSAWLKSV